MGFVMAAMGSVWAQGVRRPAPLCQRGGRFLWPRQGARTDVCALISSCEWSSEDTTEVPYLSQGFLACPEWLDVEPVTAGGLLQRRRGFGGGRGRDGGLDCRRCYRRLFFPV